MINIIAVNIELCKSIRRNNVFIFNSLGVDQQCCSLIPLKRIHNVFNIKATRVMNSSR